MVTPRINTNELQDPHEFHQTRLVGEADWWEDGLKIIRLRLVSDPGFPMWDVSYCLGEINGERYRVRLPFYQLPKGNVNGAILHYAKQDSVYAKGLNIFNVISCLQA